MPKVRFLILSVFVISLLSVPCAIAIAKEDTPEQQREKFENAKKYAMGDNLGIVAMYCTNIGGE